MWTEVLGAPSTSPGWDRRRAGTAGSNATGRGWYVCAAGNRLLPPVSEGKPEESQARGERSRRRPRERMCH